MSFLEPILSMRDGIVPNDDTFNFLNESGRKAFYSQGCYGQGITVAVIDSGIRADHAELAGRVLPGKSFVPYTQGTADDNGHGTHVAGSIAGKRCGIAPMAKLLPVKALDGEGGGTVDKVIDAFEYLSVWRGADGQPADIVSASLSIPSGMMTAAQVERFRGVLQQLNALDIAVIVSAGNTGEQAGGELRYPSWYEEPITVGAVDLTRSVAYFSTRSRQVDLCQIGVDVVSADYSGAGSYMAMSGTSMATPIAAGIAALIACKYKALFGKRIPEAALYESLKLNTLDVDVPGVDKATGAGFLTLNPMPVVRAQLTVGKTVYTVNDKTYEFEVAPYIETSGRTLIPLRAVSEILGATVEWYPAGQHIVIRR